MKPGYRLAVVVLIFGHVDLGLALANLTDVFLREDAFLNFTQLAQKYGHSVEEYEVKTEDGYILGLFRIPGFRDKRSPVLLMHGILDSADAWIIRGKTSLAITLADEGYDVWCGNMRGNKYSRKHTFLNPDTDPIFWDFSVDEYAMYDLASIIDFVLLKTGRAKLNAVGHSQGNTIFYVLGSTRTEYNQKVNVLMALAPICFLQNVAKPVRALVRTMPVLYKKALSKGTVEWPGKDLDRFFRKLCSPPVSGYVKCILGIVFPLTGYDTAQYEPSFLRVSVGHFPTETSVKNIYHYGQISQRGRFARFDYGPEENLKVYKSDTPPDYELNKVTMPVALVLGRNDYLSTVRDVALLRQKLPNVVQYTVIERKLMNHLDFIVGRNMADYLFPHIFQILNDFQ